MGRRIKTIMDKNGYMQVVFDTNAYRELVAGLSMEEIVELTRK
jgi:hypothetical protein